MREQAKHRRWIVRPLRRDTFGIFIDQSVRPIIKSKNRDELQRVADCPQQDAPTRMNPFLANVQRELCARQWNMSDLARACGCRRETINQLFRRDWLPRLDTAARIARALGTTVDSLLREPVKTLSQP